MLEINGLHKSFGGLKAISGLSLTLEPHQFLGVIGPNGAGKTTLLNLITGYVRPSEGTITFEGRNLDGLRPFEISRLGIGRTFQVVRPFHEMSVEDNVIIGALFSGGACNVSEARERCRLPLELAGLYDKRDYLASALTIGEKKKLELARALATNPRVLLLDEVMAGLPHVEIDSLVEVLRRIHQSGMTILMIEHLVPVIISLSQHVVAMNFGEKLFEGDPDSVMRHPDVVEAYLGKPLGLH